MLGSGGVARCAVTVIRMKMVVIWAATVIRMTMLNTGRCEGARDDEGETDGDDHFYENTMFSVGSRP